MSKLVIEGKNTLSGEISISGNKNAVLPMIAASLLTDEEILLRNVPDIIDVKVMLNIAESLGVSVSRNGDTLRIKAEKISTSELPHELCSRIRTSILFTAPLLHRCGEALIWPPGGDVIGRRRLDGHFYGLKSLGTEINAESIPYRFKAKKNISGKDLFLDEASVTATEHIMMFAALAKGQTIIRNAASEPHVHSLADLLIKMGAKISGLDSNTLVIDGVEKLHGTEHSVDGDHIEAGSFLAMAAATGGELTVKGTIPRHYWMTRRVFERIGVKMKLSPGKIYMQGGQELEIKPDIGNAIPVISDGPWPQFPSDMMSCMIVAATQAKGTVLFFEKMFESRIYFVDRLINMGANAIICDPHRAVICGPSTLRGIEMSSPDIRAGMALMIAALCAKGRSVIHNSDVIFRGYENIVEKIISLGGKISQE